MKTRINDLARELEVKSREILECLERVGITEKKTHSSSLEADEAEKVRKYFGDIRKGSPTSKSRPADEFKPKIDLSKISKPGDVLRALPLLPRPLLRRPRPSPLRPRRLSPSRPWPRPLHPSPRKKFASRA